MYVSIHTYTHTYIYTWMLHIHIHDLPPLAFTSMIPGMCMWAYIHIHMDVRCTHTWPATTYFHVCMYVCTYVYIYIYIYIYTCADQVNKFTRTYSYAYYFLHVFICILFPARIHMHTISCTYSYAYFFLHIHLHASFCT